MKRNINKQNKTLFNMKKIIMMVLLLCLSIVSINAVSQEELVNYQFEEGSGSLTIDISPPANIGILSSTTWSSTNFKWGLYALQFANTNNNIVDTTLNKNPNSTMTFSFWIRPANTDYDIPFSLYDTIVGTHLGFVWDSNAVKSFYYYDTTNTYKEVVMENNVLPTNVWYHIVLELDRDNHQLVYYRNNVLIYNNTFANNLTYNYDELMKLRLGTDKFLGNDYSGQMDSFRVFDTLLNTTQVASLYNSNNVVLVTENPQYINYYNNTYNTNYTNYVTFVTNDYVTNNYDYNYTYNEYVTQFVFNDTSVEHTIPDTFINFISPSSLPQSQKVIFQGGVNKSATCELYINNKLETTFFNILAFSYEKQFTTNTNNSYFIYCHYNIGEVKFYEISPIVNFQVVPSNKAVEFYFFNVNNEHLLGEDYYFVTPCFESLSPYWNYENEYYIKNIENGYTSFNLTYTSQHEFCLYRGTINYDEDNDGYSQNFDIVDIKNSIELGNIFVGEDTKNYNLKLTTEDIYKPTEPEFWGKTWASLFSFVAGLIIGGIILLLGLYVKNDKLMVVGGFIIMAGLGVSIWTFVGAIV